MGNKDVEAAPPRLPRPPRHPPPPRPPPPPAVHEPQPPWLVPIIAMACIISFIYTMFYNNCPGHTYKPNEYCLGSRPLGRLAFQPMDENPLLGPSIKTLRHLGGLDRRLVVEKEEVWRLLSCIWLHAGLFHLIANMLSLVLTGFRLEEEFGFWRIGVIYVGSGFGGSLSSCLNQDESVPTISVGASGALFGLLGSMLSELITNWTIYANKCMALSCLVLIVGLNLALGYLPRMDNSAHTGGFVAGFLLGFIFLLRPQYGYVSSKYIPAGYEMKRKKTKYKAYQLVLLVLALLALLAGYAFGLMRLFEGKK